MFFPDAKKGSEGPPAMGSISGDGTYRMSTEESGDGAIVRIHKVASTGLDPKPIGGGAKNIDDMTAQEIMAAKGRVDMPEKKTSEGPTIKAKDGRSYRLITPEKLANPDTSGISIKVDRGSNTKNIVIKDDGNDVIE